MSRINRVLVHNDVFHSKNFSAIVFHKCVSRAILYVCIYVYTPGIYADGYIVFAFPFVRSSVCSLVRLFVRSFVSSVEFASKFWLKFP